MLELGSEQGLGARLRLRRLPGSQRVGTFDPSAEICVGMQWGFLISEICMGDVVGAGEALRLLKPVLYVVTMRSCDQSHN